VPDVAVSPADLIRAGAARLRRAGIREPGRESRELWDAALESGASIRAWVVPGRSTTEQEVRAFDRLLGRRVAGEPLAYVTGEAGFRHLVLRADPRALIPRPETEGLVDVLLSRVGGGRVADIGTGTGCLALSLAQEGDFDLVVAIERSPATLALAAENRRRTGLDILPMCADFAEPLRGGEFDAIVSNPPYLTAAEYADLDRSVRAWEPAAALVSGDDGLVATRAVLVQGLVALRPGGWIALEVDSRRAEETARLAASLGWSGVTMQDDLFGRARYLLARRSEPA
jgi:release factor glutamine methyltransferase